MGKKSYNYRKKRTLNNKKVAKLKKKVKNYTYIDMYNY